MRMRKLFASLAAAATLLGGMAFAASSAQADDVMAVAEGTPMLQVQNAQYGHTYSTYKFADITYVGEEGEGENQKHYVSITTVEGWKTIVTAAAEAANGNESIPVEYADNPAAYVAYKFDPKGTGNEADQDMEFFRKFADEMNKQVQEDTFNKTAVTTTKIQNENQQGTLVDLGITTEKGGQGWYLVTDTTVKDDMTKYGHPAIVATTIDGMTGTFPVEGDDERGQGSITATGKFNAKNENPTKPEKDATVVTPGTIDYTIKHTVPASAENWNPYKLTFTDVASKGLQMPSQLSDYTVFVDNNNDGEYNEDNDTLLTLTTTDAGKNAEFNQDINQTTGETTTKIVLLDMHEYAGKQIVVKYTATVTSDAVDNVTNKVVVDNNGSGDGDGDGTTTPMTDVEFHKVNKQGTHLNGAKFKVQSDGKWLKKTTDAEGKITWTLVDNKSDGTEFTSVNKSSNKPGVFVIENLLPGTYHVVETEIPGNEYKNEYMADFWFTITTTEQDGTVTTDINILDKEGQKNAYGLASKVTAAEEGYGTAPYIHILNVRNQSELPQTGAAGIALFVILGVLLAAIAVTLLMRGQRIRRQLA